MSDRIALRGIAVEALIGVHAWEREARRPLTVDVELTFDLRDAAKSDRVEDTVDYSALTRRIRERCAGSNWLLVEALAGDLAGLCLSEPLVDAVTVTVHKPGAVQGVEDVAVTVTRSRDDA